MSASDPDIHLKIDNGRRLKTNRYGKHDDITCPIANCLFISSNIPEYEVYISQLIRYSRAGAQYSDFLDISQLLTQRLLKRRCLLSFMSIKTLTGLDPL